MDLNEEKFPEFSDREVMFISMMFSVTGYWVELWMQVIAGLMSKEDAYDLFDKKLKELGLIIASLIQGNPDLVERMAEISEDPDAYSQQLFRD